MSQNLQWLKSNTWRFQEKLELKINFKNELKVLYSIWILIHICKLWVTVLVWGTIQCTKWERVTRVGHAKWAIFIKWNVKVHCARKFSQCIWVCDYSDYFPKSFMVNSMQFKRHYCHTLAWRNWIFSKVHITKII